MGDTMKGRNASPTAFGWQFQIAASIWLMFKHFDEFEDIRVEGEFEDTEIILRTSDRILSQAKSVLDPSETSSRNTKLKQALESLIDGCEGSTNITKIIYISNYEEPIKGTYKYFIKPEIIKFLDLPSNAKKEFKKVLNKVSKKTSFNEDIFYLAAIPFINGKTKFNIVEDEIRKFLDGLKSSPVDISSRVNESFQTQFFDNATNTNFSVLISKAQIISTIILVKADNTSINDFLEMVEISDTEFEQVLISYSEFISEKSEQIDLILKTISMFDSFRINSEFKGEDLERNFFKEDCILNLSEHVFGLDEGEINTYQKLCLKLIGYKIVKTRFFSQELLRRVGKW